MTSIFAERVVRVQHWTEAQFTLSTTRSAGFRFQNGQFVMVGVEVDNRPLLRAYSIASANHEEHMHFLSIKVPNGPLTSRLQHIREGDQVLIAASRPEHSWFRILGRERTYIFSARARASRRS